jgi:hypothetical protein
MLLLSAAALSCTLAVGFTVAAARAVSHAGRAEAAAAARGRFLLAVEARGGDGATMPAGVAAEAFDTIAAHLDDDIPVRDVRPGARLAADLRLEQATVEDVALLIAARCDARLPRGRDLDALHREVTTVEQLIAYVARLAPVPAVHAA